MDKPLATIDDYKAALALADRRFARAEKAREAAEHFLEVRGRILAKVNAELKKRESDLLEQAKQDAQKLLLAQELAAVATVHVSDSRELIGSRNLATVLGLKGAVTDLDQLLAMIHPLEGAGARDYLEEQAKKALEAAR
ncbi:MAG TPA: hypothetical protein PKA59_01050, partial [Chakrabartia sp.]|nr:hypothetical protein [Chakrabartia sp.]